MGGFVKVGEVLRSVRFLVEMLQFISLLLTKRMLNDDKIQYTILISSLGDTMRQRNLKMLALLLAFVMFCLPALSACNQTSSEIETVTGEPGRDGIDGKDGKDGVDGKDGQNGVAGKSAYELAVEKGYQGTLEEWLESLVGEAGTAGQNGSDGKSAYELAVEKGYKGTLEEWLASLIGETGAAGQNGSDGKDGQNGAAGKSAYEIAVENGFKGTEAEWLASLVGAKGEDGTQGSQGEQGIKGDSGVGVENAYVNEEYHLILVLTDGSEVDAGYVGVIIHCAVTYDWNCNDPSLATTTITVDKGTVLQIPSIPERENAVFLGWYIDASCTEIFDLSAPIQDDTTLYAGWREETYEDIVEYQKAELEQLKTLNNGELPEILLHDDTYAPAFILGTYSDDIVTDFDSAKQSLKAVKNLMGFHNVDEEYVEVSSFTFKGTTQYRMQQMYNGYVVYGQQLIVTTNEDGEVTSLSGDYATIGTLFNPSVNITVEEALALTVEYSDFSSTDATLVVYTLDGYNEMTYVFDNGTHNVVISADDGAVVSSGTKVMTALPITSTQDTVVATTGRNEAGKTFNTVFLDYADPAKQDTYIFYDELRNIVYHDLNYADFPMVNGRVDLVRYLNVDVLTDSDNIWTSSASQKAISLSENLSETYGFYLQTLGLMSYDGNGGKIFAYVNDGCDSGNSAFSCGPVTYNGETVTVLSFGGVANDQNSIDVVGHEFTHSIQEALVHVGGYEQLEAGALKEAYSDVMGELIELYVNGKTDWKLDGRDLRDPQSLLEWWFEEGTAHPEKVDGVGYVDYQALLNANLQLSADLQVDIETLQSYWGHHNSTVISHAIYKMYKSEINDVAELTELLYRAWSYLSFDASFYDYRMAMLAAASDMDFNSKKISCIMEAFDDANVKFESYDDSWQIGAMVNLYCKVVDNNGDVIPNAHILVERTDANGTDVAEVQCDEKGEHRIDLFLAGVYKITVSAVGYETHEGVYSFGMFSDPQKTFELTNLGSQGIKFISNKDGTCYVSGIGNCIDTNVVIPPVSPAGDVVTSIGESAFEGNSKLISVVIPEGVAKIESGAFQNCSALESIDIPNGLQEIGSWAFYGCVKLNNVSLPISLRKVYNGAFDNCTSLNTASYPASEEEWHKNVSLSADNKNLTDALGFCHHDVNDTFRPALGPVFRSNGDGTCAIIQFNTCDCCLCKGINSGDIVLPAYSPDGERVTSIEGFIDRYSYGRHITSIAIPDSVESIGDGAFGMCYSLTDVYYDGTEAQWNSIRIGEDNDCLASAALHFKEPEPTYSEGLSFTSDGDGACYVSGIGTCTDTDIVIPSVSPDGDSVTSIGDFAFGGCENLTSITIPDGVTSIGYSAFACCTSLASITIPNSVTSIDDCAFENCSSLTNIVIPEGVAVIEPDTFLMCYSLESITIPDSLTRIESNVFERCDNLTDVYYNGTKAQWEKIAIDRYGNELLLRANIHLAGGELLDNDKLIYASNGDGTCYVSGVGLCVDSEIVIPSVNSFGEYVTGIRWLGYPGVESIVIPNSVTSISAGAFRYCSNLKKITVEEGNPVYYSYKNCVIETASKTLVVGCSGSVIPADGSVKHIGSFAFGWCDELTEMIIPEGVISIADDAFSYLSVDTIYIPKSMKSIGEYALGHHYVQYNGTKEQWRAMDVGECRATIYCSDGVIYPEY